MGALMTVATARMHGPAFLWARAPRAVAAALCAAVLATGGVIAAFLGADHIGEPIGAIVFAGACTLCTALGALIVASVPRHGLGVALLVGGLLTALWSLAVPLA